MKGKASRNASTMPAPAPPGKDDRTKLTIYIASEIARALQHEAVDRQLTYGEIVEEALASRAVLVRKDDTP